MKKWTTEIKAICPLTKELRRFAGPIIEAPSPRLANEYCQLHGLGYCKVIGEFIIEVTCKRGFTEPDRQTWSEVKTAAAVQYN